MALCVTSDTYQGLFKPLLVFLTPICILCPYRPMQKTVRCSRTLVLRDGGSPVRYGRGSFAMCEMSCRTWWYRPSLRSQSAHGLLWTSLTHSCLAPKIAVSLLLYSYPLLSLDQCPQRWWCLSKSHKKDRIRVPIYLPWEANSPRDLCVQKSKVGLSFS